MKAQILDGRKVQQQLMERARRSALDEGIVPHVALVQVRSDEPLSDVNFRLHAKVFQDVGFTVTKHVLESTTTQDQLGDLIDSLNADDEIDAIMVLMPLPEQLDIRVVLASIDPSKEIEGLHPAHAIRLSPLSALPPSRFPVVPMAVLELLSELDLDTSGIELVVLTDPELTENNPVAKMVARVAAFAALPTDASASVVPLTHPKVRELTRRGDVLIVSVLQRQVVTADWVKPGAIVIDFNAIFDGFAPHPTEPGREVARLTGGLDVESVAEVARAIAAVPGGVGPALLGTVTEQIVMVATIRAMQRVAAPA